jgi:hypothetical protein
VDEKKLLKSLSDITATLKGIADGLGVSTGVKAKSNVGKSGSLSKEELAKQKEITKLNVEEYQKTLGLNFKDKSNLDKIADRFRVVFQTSTTIRLITGIRDNIKELKDSWIKQITKTDSIYKKNSTNLIKNLGWEDFKTEILWNIREEENHRNFVVDSWESTNSLLERLVSSYESPKKDKKDSLDIMSKLKNIAGLALLGGGMYLIIQALVNSGDIDLVKTLKVLGVVTAFLGLFWLVGEKLSKLKSASIGFAILSATILFLVIPTIEQLANMPFDVYINGIIKFGIIMVGVVGILKLMDKVKGSDVIKSTLGFGLLSVFVGFILIPMLDTISDISYSKVLTGMFNMGLVVGGLSLIVKLMSKVDGSEVIKSTFGLTIFSAFVSFLLIPMLETISDSPLDKFLMGLFNFGLVVGGLSLIIKMMGKLVGGTAAKDLLIGMATMVGLSFLMGYLAENLNKFSSFDWKNIYTNLGLAVLAIGLFGTVVFGIGALVANPVVAPLLAVGAVAVLGLSFLMGMIADSASKFNDIDGQNLSEVGKGIASLGVGLAAFLVGMAGGVAAGVVGKLSGLFGLNPADQIKKFENIDSAKIFELGLGLKYMGESLKLLSSGIDLKGITNQLMELTTPLINFTFSLDKFNKSFADLDKTISKSEIVSVYKLKIENENNIQNSILELNKQELQVQQAQLEELRLNSSLLKAIADNIGFSGGSMSGKIASIPNKGGESISSANFSTKNNYLNHMKLTSMSFAG